MPDSMNPTRDMVRAELLRAGVEALHQLAPDLREDVGRFLELLHAGLSTADLAHESPETMAAATASLWSFAAERRPGEALLRIIPPGQGSGPRAVAEIVTDDMPFLVDSALAVLTASRRAIRQLLHPVVAVHRDGAGRLLGIGPAAGSPAAGTALRESQMRIEFTGSGVAGAAGAEWAGLEAALRAALADVRAANEDHAAMVGFLRAAESELAATPVTAEAGPAQEFLRWLNDDNYVLLGHRRMTVADDGRMANVEAESLGLLRDPNVAAFDALHDLDAIPPGVRATILAASPASVGKANLRSTVHRPQHGDVVITRIFGPDGRVTGARLFYGLFAATAYSRNPRSIPLLAQKVNAILASSGLDPNSHDGRALRHALDTWPRDELFQAPEEAILEGARRALDLKLRPRPALVVRRDPFERFVSAIVWLPRDNFDTRLRERVGRMLARAYAGHIAAFYIAMGDEPLARVNYIVSTTPGHVPTVDVGVLEIAASQAARDFNDRLGEALADAEGEATATRLLARWADAFPISYRESASASQAVDDLLLAETAILTGRAAAQFRRPPGTAPDRLTMRIVKPDAPLPLADALPLLESLDLRALEENPYELTPAAGTARVALQVFTLHAGVEIAESAFAPLLETLDALLDGRAEADGFNRLVLRAGLTWRECWLLRTLYRWLKQVGFSFSQASVEAALAAHPKAARILVGRFHARFAPTRDGEGARPDDAGIDAQWRTVLEAVANPDEDRILNRMMTLVRALLRTNYYQDKPYLAVKIATSEAGDVPQPHPWCEIFVHSTRMEGCHLRAGAVARGGIRWSDRREDFRTEILGLMKAQRLKNAIIVPTGAKGGFVLKQAPSPSDRQAFLAEGQACYRILINAMLDLSDNVDGTHVTTPAGVVRRDGDDPYIVAAADKGTATFSDLANSIAIERHFWLDDAFASGGSHGYDHKEMGITAKGAWVMIAWHFSELGLDIFAQNFTCVGVGDMSGDVFGNGLLISRKTRLLAAFDHRHIFIDPDPDAEISYAERARMFALPRSSWADYDRAKISAGGGVFDRSEKRIALSAEARALLGIAEASAEPATVMNAILRAPVDLLYFGGIGTYVKASAETHAQVGDRANDAIRANGAEIRARVIGEGANLGITQAGRIEYAQCGGPGGAGGRVNTDALDNSAGVSTSDQEVNIKVLLSAAEREGGLTRRQRDELLTAMTDEVGVNVLRDNHRQSLAASMEEAQGASDLPALAALMTRLEAEGLLDRAVAGMPDAATLQARQAAGQTLFRPEIAALMPVAKLWLKEAIAESSMTDDPAFEPVLLAYFPRPAQARFAPQIKRHRLRRALLATVLANAVVNRLGLAALSRLTSDAEPVRVARAAWLAGVLLDVETACEAIAQAPAPTSVRLNALLAMRRLEESTAGDLMESPEFDDRPLATWIDALHPGIALLAREAAAEAECSAEAAELHAAGLPASLAAEVAAAAQLAAAPAIVRLATAVGVPPDTAAAAWRRVGEGLGIEALRTAVGSLPARGAFDGRARTVLLADLMAVQRRLAHAALDGHDPAADPRAGAVVQLMREVAAAPDLAGFGLAVRALASLQP